MVASHGGMRSVSSCASRCSDARLSAHHDSSQVCVPSAVVTRIAVRQLLSTQTGDIVGHFQPVVQVLEMAHTAQQGVKDRLLIEVSEGDLLFVAVIA